MSNMARLFLIGALFVAIGESAAADNLISIDSLSTISEDFNGMGSANIAPLPQGWLFSASSLFAGSFQSQYSAGTTGFGAITATSHSGYYNFADGDDRGIPTDCRGRAVRCAPCWPRCGSRASA